MFFTTYKVKKMNGRKDWTSSVGRNACLDSGLDMGEMGGTCSNGRRSSVCSEVRWGDGGMDQWDGVINMFDD